MHKNSAGDGHVIYTNSSQLYSAVCKSVIPWTCGPKCQVVDLPSAGGDKDDEGSS